MQVVADVDAGVRPEPASGTLVLRSGAPFSAAGELQATEELDPFGFLRLLVLPDGHLLPVVLNPEVVRPAVDLFRVGVFREAHLHQGVPRHLWHAALGADHAVWHTQLSEHGDEDDAEPGAVGVAPVPDVRGVRDRLVHAAILRRPPRGEEARLVANALLHLKPDDEELLDEVQSCQLFLQVGRGVAFADELREAAAPGEVLHKGCLHQAATLLPTLAISAAVTLVLQLPRLAARPRRLR